jgi:hypothetical protein
MKKYQLTLDETQMQAYGDLVGSQIREHRCRLVSLQSLATSLGTVVPIPDAPIRKSTVKSRKKATPTPPTE